VVFSAPQAKCVNSDEGDVLRVVCVLALLQDEMLRLAFDCNRNIAPLAELARRHRDRNPDLADLCLIRMSELYPRHVVITVDSDFGVYRRNRREAIPIHLPPKRP
jgi:uncharacterized protein